MAELEVVQLEVGLGHNLVEILACPETGQAALVDPAFEVDRILAEVGRRRLTVTTLLLTHGHLDHINGLGEAARATGAVARCHPHELSAARAETAAVVPVADGERIAVGAGVVEAMFAPGHTPGCVCWYLPDTPAIITGDVLFVGSTGAIGLPDSDPRAMFETLQRLAALPEETRIYPGHDYGPTPTRVLATELRENPAFRAATVEELCRLKRVPVPAGG
jgi:hydroxyacylglutathione hydrolase